MPKKKIRFTVTLGILFMGGTIQVETLDAHIEKLEFTHDFANWDPTDATQRFLFDEIELQRDRKAHIWSIALYELDKRYMISNDQMIADLSYCGNVVF